MTFDTQTLKRFFRKWTLNTDTGCWDWDAGKIVSGYGVFRVNGRASVAHIVAYRMFIGDIPEGLELDHTCRNRGCVNPAHLEPVTHQENCKRGDVGKHYRDKTHCPSGHEYNAANTYRYKNKRGCMECRRISSREQYRKRMLSK